MSEKDKRDQHNWLWAGGLLGAISALVTVLMLEKFQRKGCQNQPVTDTSDIVPQVIGSSSQINDIPLEVTAEEVVGDNEKKGWSITNLASAFIPIASAAIFFISGWVYEAHWYGYFGLNIFQNVIIVF